MTKHQTPEDASAALTAALSEFKAAAFERAPRPSAELLARLDLHGASGKVAPTKSSSAAIEALVSADADTVSDKKRVRQMFSWLAGLGVFAKIVLASSVASAAVLGAGAAGVLPESAQEAFNTVVSSVTEDPEATPTDEPTPAPSASYDNFGGYVSELAHQLGKGSDGRAFGETISEAAKNKHHGKPSDENESDEESTQDDEPGVHTPAGGKPAGTPGGKKG